VDNWLRHIKDIRAVHERELARLSSVQAREDRLTELNVMHQVVHLAESSFVEQAWAAGRSLSIHGWAYSLTDGLIRDLGVTMTGGQDLEPLLERLRIVR
jgi:carbonic anhydrase